MTKAADPLASLASGISAQSVYAPEYGVELAIDGSPDPVPGVDLPAVRRRHEDSATGRLVAD